MSRPRAGSSQAETNVARRLRRESMSLTPADVDQMKVAELQAALSERGLPAKGKKAELAAALLTAVQRQALSSLAPLFLVFVWGVGVGMDVPVS
jgi:hypothetical protein